VASKAVAGVAFPPVTSRAEARAIQPEIATVAEEPGLASGDWPRGVDRTRHAFIS
jgi:hypothetical protein